MFGELLRFDHPWRPNPRDTSADTSHFWCSQGFPPTNQRWHERSRSLTCNIFRYQEEHRRTSLLRPFATLLHLLEKLHDLSSCSCFTAVQQPGILFFLLQDLCSSSPCCGLRDIMQKPSTAFRTLHHLRHLVLMQPPSTFPFSSFFFHLLQPLASKFCKVHSHPVWVHALSQSAANSSETQHRFSASILPFGLIFLIRSFIITISLLLLHLFFFR